MSLLILHRKLLLPLLFDFFHFLLVLEDFCAYAVVELDEYYDEPQVIYDGLEIEEIGVPGEPIEPGNPKEECVQNREGDEACHQKLGFQVLVGEAHVTADEQELENLDVNQKRILIKHDFDERHHENGVAFDSENAALILFDVMLGRQSYDRVSFSDDLPDLKQNKSCENEVGRLEEVYVLLEDLD